MKVVCVSRRPVQPTYPHDAISGAEALLAGVARSDGAALTEYQWEFGDGTKSPRLRVGDPMAVEARHTYIGPLGRIFRATLTVWDETGASFSDDYYVRIRADNLRTRAQRACDSALWNLHKRMMRYEQDGIPVGYWDNGGNEHRIGITAACIQAFENLGNFPFGDAEESPYVDDVRRALNQLLLDMKAESISPQSAGDPDSNGNGIGIFCHHEQSLRDIFSSQGLAIMALVMSRDPERVAAVGEPHVLGRKFVDIAQDMVDFVAFGQTDSNPEGKVARGGWRYDSANSGDSDMVCTVWPVCGLMVAEKDWGKFGISVPVWVKEELRENFLVAAHDAGSGGWLYMPTVTAHLNAGLTACGITCSAWTGLPVDDAMVQGGLGHIAANWESKGQFGHFSSTFNMYSVCSAMRAYGLNAIGDHDWHREYVEHLIASQKPDGSWSSEGYEQSWPIVTAWAVLILLRPQTPPWVVIDEPESAQQNDVTIGYRLFDDNYDECDILAEFSVDGGESWNRATQAGGDAVTYIEALPEGLPRRFAWDSLADVGKANLDNVLFRFTPSDGERGEAGETVLPGVYNDVVPFERLEVNAPAANGRGAAFGDFDNDGDLDLFVANFGQDNFLFRNDSGELVEMAQSAGISGRFPSTCGVWGDFNNDGALDLYLVLAGRPNKLYAGDGRGSFTEVASRLWADDAGGGVCASWVDYNNDNWLDVYVANDPALGFGFNGLYRNYAEAGFLNLAGVLGVNSPLPTRGAAWCDFDRDGWIDLYIANRTSLPALSSPSVGTFGAAETSAAPENANSLLRNLSDLFLDVSEVAGVGGAGDASAVLWADLNNDGFPDIYVVNSGQDDNVLFLNNRDGMFHDATASAGLEGPANDRGAAAADFDNDGDLDLFVSANGRNCLYINRGDCTFADVASLAGMGDLADSRGAAWGDVNGDGFLDLYVANSGSKGVLYLNRRTEGNWLKVRCLTDSDGDATDSNYSDDRDAIGAVVEVDFDGDMDFSSQRPDRLGAQCVDGGSGYMSQGQLVPHFGLGSYRAADVKVTFPDGSVVYKCGLSANQTVVVRDIAPAGDLYVEVFTPSSPRSGEVPIGYVIFNSGEKYCDVNVEYSLDGGKTWEFAIMGTGGDGWSRLLSSPSGVFHRFVWNSLMDLGFSNSDTVRIRITPFGPDQGSPAETSDFSVYNNTPPRVSVETPSLVGTGGIAIRYVLFDTQSDKCSIGVEYSSDAGTSWRPASMGIGGDGVLALSSSPDGIFHIYAWNSLADIARTIHNDIKVRITPFDKGRGTPGQTGLFTVDNNLAPSATVETPPSAQKGEVVLSYRLLDTESDRCSVAVFYSLDGARSWKNASRAPTGEGTTGLKSSPGGEAHVYVWDSLRDFGNDYASAVRMMIVPRDAKTGVSGQTGDFAVDNLRPPELAFSPTSLSFLAQHGGKPPVPQVVEVWNKGSHSLQWSAASDVAWIVVSPSSGSSSGEKDVIEVSADVTALSPGTYTGSVVITAPGAIGSPATIPVLLEILPPPPCLDVSELLLSFNAREGGDPPAPQYFVIRNIGGGEMPWQAQADREWITAVPDSGTSRGEGDVVVVRVNAIGLASGSHSGTITVSAPGAANSPQTVLVSLDIEPAVRELIVSPSELTFVTRRSGPNPPEQQLRLRVSGGAEASWQAHHEAAWLSLSPSSGTNSGEETVVRVSVEKAGLYIGTYRAEVTFAAIGLPIEPKKVVVSLNVVPIVVPDDFPTIQQAINAAEPLDVVSVKPGLYLEKVAMKNGVDVVGSGAEVTTIRADREGTVVVFQSIGSATLEGFTITGGIGDFFGRERRVGGGVYCASSSATISRCSISGNSASWGGGICVDKSSTLRVVDCAISQNDAASGGGIFCYEDCRAILERTRVFDNSVIHSGAGACVISRGLIVLKSCELFRNSAELGGGGIYGGAFASLEVVNCTVADNRKEGILANPGCSVTISNTILWSNSEDLVIPSGQSVRYCDIGTDGFAGSDGNISAEPLFVAPDESCYELLPNSPCIDAGSNEMPGLPATDIRGQPRIVAVRGSPIADIGAHEHDPKRIFVIVGGAPEPAAGGQMKISFSLWNARSLPATVVAEFSIGGAAWRPATRADGTEMTDLSSSPTGSSHAFIWDSIPDLKGEAPKSVRVRIRLSGEDARPGGTTAPFSVDNTLSDSDRDGLPDAWEETFFGSTEACTADGDPDGDRTSNIKEYLARTNPLDPNSSFRASCFPGQAGTIVIRWHSVAGRLYQVYWSDPMGAEWIPLGPRQAGTGGELTTIDETLGEQTGQRYYVVRVE